MVRTKLTYDDLVRLPDDGLRHELIDGEHYVSPAPAFDHQAVVVNLTREISIFLRSHPIGNVVGAPFGVKLTRYDVVEPDVMYFSRERAREIYKGTHLDGAPELVVEIESPSTRHRDQVLKRDLYARQGVREFWLIATATHTVTIFRAADGESSFDGRGTVLPPPDVLTTPLLPGFELPLAQVFDCEPRM